MRHSLSTFVQASIGSVRDASAHELLIGGGQADVCAMPNLSFQRTACGSC